MQSIANIYLEIVASVDVISNAKISEHLFFVGQGGKCAILYRMA